LTIGVLRRDSSWFLGHSFESSYESLSKQNILVNNLLISSLVSSFFHSFILAHFSNLILFSFESSGPQDNGYAPATNNEQNDSHEANSVVD